MIIYCTRLWLDTDLLFLLDSIGAWLEPKLRRNIDHDILLTHSHIPRDGTPKADLFLERCDDTYGYPHLYAFKLQHKDRAGVPGRLWLTEIGIRVVRDAPIEVSVLLHTSDIHLRANHTTTMTRPRLVRQLLDECNPTRDTPGVTVNEIDELNAIDLWNYINNPTRQHPGVIIAPDKDGNYLVDPDSLLYQVGGIADVIQIMPYADTFDIEEIVTPQYTPYLGAISIVHPPPTEDNVNVIRSQRILPDDLQQMAAHTNGQPERELLAMLSRQVKLANKWAHISPTKVQQERLRRDAARSHNHLQDAETYKSLAEMFEQEMIAAENSQQHLQEDYQRLEDENTALTRKVASLQTALHDKQANAASTVPVEIRDALTDYILETLTLADALFLLEYFFRDRVVVLQTAHRSAAAYRHFEHTQRAFQILWRLATVYWEALANGNGGDAQAREIFGDTYSANESDTVTQNRRARRERTFRYGGKDIFMEQHLIIGRRDNQRTTWRAHFHWDATAQRLVIGHCGKHLYLPSHS